LAADLRVSELASENASLTKFADIQSQATQSIDLLIPRTLGPFYIFILLNGWTCLHGVLD